MTDVDDHPSIPHVIKAQTVPEFEYEDIQKGEKIGVGGDANVYKATISKNNDEFEFALKEPRFEGTVQTEIFERFEEEAKTWSGLDDHQNIVSVHGFGASSIPWIALEYMDGGTVAERIEEIEFEEALWMAGRIAEGIRYGHRHGVAHLDLKPTNVLLRETPEGKWEYPKVSDWGLAKMLLEQSESVEGLSPTYAAPEQFNAGDYGRPDDITDIYQFGAIVYELLTGQPPFTGSPTNVMQSVLNDVPSKPSEVNPELPAEVDEVILKSLAKDKEARYDSILLLQKQLDQLFYDYATELEVDVEAPERLGSSASVDVSDQASGGADESSGTQATKEEPTSDKGSKIASRRTVLATLGLGGVVGGGVFATQSSTNIFNGLLNQSNTNQSNGNLDKAKFSDSFKQIWKDQGTSFVLAGDSNFYYDEWVSEVEWAIKGVDAKSGESVFQTEAFDDNRYRDVWDSSSLEIDNQYLYVGQSWNSSNTAPNNAKLTAINRTDESIQWEFETPPGGKHNRIRQIHLTENKILFAADWNFNAPTSLDEQNPLVFAVNKDTGEELWRTPHSSERVFDIQDVSIAQNNVFVTDGSSIDVLDIETGKLKDQLFSDGSSKFVVSNGVLYNFATTLSAYELSNGQIAWETTSPSEDSTELVEESESNIYAVVSNLVFEISKSSGTINWSTPVVAESFSYPNALTVRDSTVWLSDYNGNVYILDRKTGEQVFSLSDEQESYGRPTTSIDDIIFVGGTTNSFAYKSLI